MRTLSLCNESSVYVSKPQKPDIMHLENLIQLPPAPPTPSDVRILNLVLEDEYRTYQLEIEECTRTNMS